MILILLLITILILLVYFYAHYIAIKDFHITRYTLNSHKNGLHTLKILHVTDTHLCSGREYIIDYLTKILSENQFDFIFLTGDMIEDKTGIKMFLDFFPKFKSRYGVYFSIGAHDFNLARPINLIFPHHFLKKNPDSDKYIEQVKNLGCTVLLDENIKITINDRTINIIGIRDCHKMDVDYEKAFKNIDPNEINILLSHSPEVILKSIEFPVHAIFAGHTHGGQIRIPLLGALVTRTNIDRKYSSGMFNITPTQILITNHGMGTGKYSSIRLFCPPEVVIATITI